MAVAAMEFQSAVDRRGGSYHVLEREDADAPPAQRAGCRREDGIHIAEVHEGVGRDDQAEALAACAEIPVGSAFTSVS